MLIGAAGLAFLVILVVIGERAGSRLWHAGLMHRLDYCERCDLRYPQVAGESRASCPEGHPLAAAMHAPWDRHREGNAVIAVCVCFITAVLILSFTGVIHTP